MLPKTKPAQRSQSSAKVKEGSFFATVVMTHSDGANVFKACSTKTHMGGSPRSEFGDAHACEHLFLNERTKNFSFLFGGRLTYR